MAKSGFLGLTGGRLAAGVLSWLWLLVAARAMSLDEFGDLALLLALAAIFSVVADLGLPLVLVRTTAERPNAALSALLMTVRRRLTAGIVAAAAVVLAFRVTASRPSFLLPCLFGISILCTTVYTSVNAALRGLAAPRAEALNEVASRLFVLVVGGYWVIRGGGLLAAVVTYSAADLVSAMALFAVAWHRLPRDEEAHAGDFSIRRAAPLAIAGVLGTIYYRIDVWLLAGMTGARAVALYAAAYRLLDGVLLPSGALSALMVPLTTPLRPLARVVFVDRILRLAVLASVAVFATGTAVASPLLGRTFGPDYMAASGVLRILLLGVAPGVAVLVIAPLAALADRRRFAQIVSAAMVLNILLNVVFIPRWGPSGAAWATVVSQMVLAAQLRCSLARSTGRIGRYA